MVTWQLTIDANDPDRLARFWAPALGYRLQPPPEPFRTYREWYLSMGVPADELEDLSDDYADRIVDPSGEGPPIWFQIVPETKAGKNRLHLDLFPTGKDRSLPMERRVALVDATVAELEASGARVVRRDRSADRYAAVLADPEGNEFCVA